MHQPNRTQCDYWDAVNKPSCCPYMRVKPSDIPSRAYLMKRLDEISAELEVSEHSYRIARRFAWAAILACAALALTHL